MSQFLSVDHNGMESSRQEIDFEDAIRLPDGGSTCEIYRTRWQRREVFVKRLKEEFRTNPLYLDALDKEYEIGVSLKHPSLPDYREFHREYIVMDYIDGTPLSEMIRKQDPWLGNEKNIIRMLKELVIVTDYLHRHHITHCDIKPDNILITANNYNLVLIDLDKCYTDSLNDTSGDPSKYGLSQDDKGSVAIDFHGIARVVEKIKSNVPGFTFSRYTKFIKECNKPAPSTDELLNILDYNPASSRKFYLLVTFAPFCVALIFGLVLWLTQGTDGYDESYGEGIPATQSDDSIKTTSKDIKPVNEVPEDERETMRESRPKNEKIIKEPLTQQQLHVQAKEMAEVLDKRIAPYFEELNLSLDNLEAFSKTPGISDKQLRESIRKHVELEDDYCHEAFEILYETFPGLTERESWRVMEYSKVYTNYKRRSDKFLSETERREKEINHLN